MHSSDQTPASLETINDRIDRPFAGDAVKLAGVIAHASIAGRMHQADARFALAQDAETLRQLTVVNTAEGFFSLVGPALEASAINAMASATR